MAAENPSESSSRVFLYALSTCSHCKDVKKFLDGRNIEYESVEVDLLKVDERKRVLEQVKQYNSRVTFPTTVIGSQVIIGNKKDKLEAALEKVTDGQ
ncbi:MAG: glutaredoxin family protein [Desulfobacterales bacterium]|nr:glutaredoxin family protein [Desulfobacterales bacterium]